MGKFSDRINSRRRQPDEPYPNWRATGEQFSAALKIWEADPDHVGALLLELRKAQRFDEVEQLREWLKKLAEMAKLQLKVAEGALQRVDQATKPRLVP